MIVLDCSIIFEEKCRSFATHFWLRLLTTWESWSLPGDSPILDTCNLDAWNFSTTWDIWITKSFVIWHWFDRLSYLWTWLHLFEENDSSMKTLSHGHVDTSWWGQEPTRSKRHGEVSEPSRSLWGLSKKNIQGCKRNANDLGDDTLKGGLLMVQKSCQQHGWSKSLIKHAQIWWNDHHFTKQEKIRNIGFQCSLKR